jgi:hypothetical protein
VNLDPMPEEMISKFTARVGPDFRWTDVVLQLAESDMVMRCLVGIIIEAPEVSDRVFLAMGARMAELRKAGGS